MLETQTLVFNSLMLESFLAWSNALELQTIKYTYGSVVLHVGPISSITFLLIISININHEVALAK